MAKAIELPIIELPPRFDSQGRRWHHPDYLKEEKMLSEAYNKARHIAREYQSPGAIGKVFAAFASGIPVRQEDFDAEIEATLRECGDDAADDMQELREFSELNADDTVWKYDCEYHQGGSSDPRDCNCSTLTLYENGE